MLFDRELKDLDGQPILITEGGPATKLSTICCIALNGQAKLEPEKPTDPTERYSLALQLHNATELSISSEQIVMLKELIRKTFPSPLISGQACLMLEGKQWQ